MNTAFCVSVTCIVKLDFDGKVRKGRVSRLYSAR